MITLRAITEEDIGEIESWPTYEDGFEQMDYALRKGGWIDEYRNRADTWFYVAELNKQVVGFSLLSVTAKGEAEFRIAIHPRRTGAGFGREVTLAVLKIGFCKLGMDRINLIVRKNNYRAIKLYERLGFKKAGESIHTIQGRLVEFFDMDVAKESFSQFKR
jgi:ribosomal protein S18 acetylase RimI-like enzyme